MTNDYIYTYYILIKPKVALLQKCSFARVEKV